MKEENAKNHGDLHRAAAEGRLDAVETLLSKGIKVNNRNAFGWTPLMQAVRGGHAATVASLLSHGADINVFNELGGSMLSMAAAAGDEKILRLLLEAGMEVTGQQDTTSAVPPLVAAAGHGHEHVVELLIDKGCSVNDSALVSGATPLHMAVAGLHVGCVRVLLQRGADATVQDEAGCTPLDLVTSHPWSEGCDKQKLQHLRSMLASEASDMRTGWDSEVLECTRSGDSSSMERLLSELRPLDKRTAHVHAIMFTALLSAATLGHQQISSQLILYGADINSVGNEGLTPLMLAATHGHVGVCRVLLDAGADVHVRCSGSGHTAFELASLEEDVPSELLRLLARRTLTLGQTSPQSLQPWPVSPQSGSPLTWSKRLQSGAQPWPLSPQPQHEHVYLYPETNKKGASSLPGSPNYQSSVLKFGWPYSPIKVKPKDLMEKVATSPNLANSQSTPKKLKHWMNRVSSKLANLN